MQVIKAPAKVKNSDGNTVIFLAGSIENGAAENWQARAEGILAKYDDILVLNPRRDDWDTKMDQTSDNITLVRQIKWELLNIDDSDLVILYLDPETKSPISLMELGHVGGNPETREKLYVVCQPGFWRKANVDVYCDKYDIPLFDTLEEAIDQIEEDHYLELIEEPIEEKPRPTKKANKQIYN